MHVMRVAILKRKKKGHLCVAPLFLFPNCHPFAALIIQAGIWEGEEGERIERIACVMPLFSKRGEGEEMLAAATGAPRCGKNFPEACEL